MNLIKKRVKKFYTTSNFWSGFGSILNISGNYYPYVYEEKSDSEALKSDWNAIGEDFKKVLQ